VRVSDIELEEYKMLREEIRTRVKIGHGIILWATILVLPATGFMLWLQHTDLAWFNFYCLSLPIVWTMLGFNYQANLRTMLGAARFSDEIRRRATGNEVSWDQFHKVWKNNDTAGLLLGLPLVLPQAVLLSWGICSMPVNPTTAVEAIVQVIFYIFLLVGFVPATRNV